QNQSQERAIMHQVIAGNLLASTKLFIFYLGCKTRFAGGLRMTAAGFRVTFKRELRMKRQKIKVY
ncbi:MAG: hypothetical protein RB294_07770, partial [Bacteroidales bacterium]|nr:hypothetical protein [Bacteroidales bacterium]